METVEAQFQGGGHAIVINGCSQHQYIGTLKIAQNTGKIIPDHAWTTLSAATAVSAGGNVKLSRPAAQDAVVFRQRLQEGLCNGCGTSVASGAAVKGKNVHGSGLSLGHQVGDFHDLVLLTAYHAAFADLHQNISGIQTESLSCPVYMEQEA